MKKTVFVFLLTLCCVAGFAQNKKGTSKTSAKVAASAEKGKIVYINFCMACHQSDGSGVPTINPPLSKTPGVAGAKSYLIDVVLKGSRGQVVINGEKFGSVMPPMAHLTDEQIADVLTYIRNNFENKATAVTAAEVKAARGKLK